MQPFEPELRDRLKRAHPGLTDDDLDEIETLLCQRVDEANDRGGPAARATSSRWREVVATKVPRLREIMQAYERDARRDEPPRPKPPVEVRRKPAPR